MVGYSLRTSTEEIEFSSTRSLESDPWTLRRSGGAYGRVSPVERAIRGVLLRLRQQDMQACSLAQGRWKGPGLMCSDSNRSRLETNAIWHH